MSIRMIGMIGLGKFREAHRPAAHCRDRPNDRAEPAIMRRRSPFMLGRLGTLVAGARATILAGMLALCVTVAWNLVRAEELPKPSSIVEIAVRDGVKIAAAISLPQGSGKVPALLA